MWVTLSSSSKWLISQVWWPREENNHLSRISNYLDVSDLTEVNGAFADCAVTSSTRNKIIEAQKHPLKTIQLGLEAGTVSTNYTLPKQAPITVPRLAGEG